DRCQPRGLLDGNVIPIRQEDRQIAGRAAHLVSDDLSAPFAPLPAPPSVHCFLAAMILGWSGLISRLCVQITRAWSFFSSSSSRVALYSAMREKPISFIAG